MSRKVLSFLVGGIGVLVAFATLFGLSVMGSLLADARTEHITGPGVDLFLRTPFPTPGSEVVLEVVARGGSRAGLSRALVTADGEKLAAVEGRGATWGSTISGNKSRGSAGETLRFPLPARLIAGDTLHLNAAVSYVVAMSSGAGTFRNEPRHDVVRVDVPVLSSSDRHLSQAKLGTRALGLLAVWFVLVWGVVFLFVTAKGEGDGELEGIGLLMGLMGGGLLGYWFFTRPLAAAWELTSTVWEVLLTALWSVLPLAFVWRWSKRRVKLERFVLRAVESGRAVEVEVRDIPGWLPAALGLEVRERTTSLHARRGKARLRVRWNGQRIPLDQLVIEATDVRLPLELAHRAAGRTGKLMLVPTAGPSLLVDPARTVDEIEREYSAAVIAEAQRLLAVMGSLRLPGSGR